MQYVIIRQQLNLMFVLHETSNFHNKNKGYVDWVIKIQINLCDVSSLIINTKYL